MFRLIIKYDCRSYEDNHEETEVLYFDTWKEADDCRERRRKEYTHYWRQYMWGSIEEILKKEA